MVPQGRRHPWGWKVMAMGLVLGAIGTTAALAHFQVLLPSKEIVTEEDEKTISLDILFTHPMAGGPVMEMGQPTEFGVLIAGEEKRDLLPTLTMKKIDGKTAFTASYTIQRPGDHIFYIAPAPYWEPAEEKMIIHYTKVVVDGLGGGEGWDAMVGFPIEIHPLVRPYGLWTGNLFRGIVKKNGQPLPFAEIEVEYWNPDKTVRPPSDPFVTQVIKADANGVFSYAMPRAGWWAFAALTTAETKMKSPEGKEVEVELGGLLWVKTVDMK